LGYLAGTDQEAIIQIATELLTQKKKKKLKISFGDGFFFSKKLFKPSFFPE
jgi:hypothetical protein